jgi:hypothetical protein
MFTGLCILFAGFMIAYSIYWLRRVISSIWEEAEGITHLFFAIQRTQLRLELFEAELEIPDWLEEMDEERDADWDGKEDTEEGQKTDDNQGAKVIRLNPTQEDV